MVENRPWLTALSHIVLSLGVLVTALPIWITFVASTHPVEALMSGRAGSTRPSPTASSSSSSALRAVASRRSCAWWRAWRRSPTAR